MNYREEFIVLCLPIGYAGLLVEATLLHLLDSWVSRVAPGW